MVSFVSSYDLLQTSERVFVDEFLHALEADAERRFERLTATLDRVARSLDLDAMDDRTRDLFAKPMVRAAIHERVKQLADERDLTPERVIREHAAVAFANMQDYLTVGQDGLPTVDMETVNRAQWSAVSQIEVEDSYGPKGNIRKIKFKLHDKLASLAAISKFMGLDKSDNPEYVAYKLLPRDMVQLPASATQETLAEDYARLIDG